MAISVPFSLQMTRDEDAISIIEGAVPDVVSGRFKIFLGANVIAGRPQVYVGSLRACYRHLMNEVVRQGTPGDKIAVGDWQTAGAANILLPADTIGITDDDVAIVVAANFNLASGATHFYTETFNQLMNGLLERASDN